jgi:hypothetical protein
MVSNEAVQKKFILPTAAFVNRLCAVGHLIKRSSFQILASAAPSDRLHL